MYGLKALQADGLVAQRQEVKPAVQMRNSVDTYYRNVLPTAKTTSSYNTYNRFRGQAHGGAPPQEDWQHLLQHLHGCPLTPVPNLHVSPDKQCKEVAFVETSFCFQFSLSKYMK